MIARIHRDADIGGQGGSGDTGAASTAGGVSPETQGSGSGGESGSITDGEYATGNAEVSGGGSGATGTPDWNAIRQNDLKGIEIPEEYLEEYERKVTEGFFDKQPEQAEAPEQASQPQYTEAEKKLMAEFGAKTPEEAWEKARAFRNQATQAMGKAKEAEVLKQKLLNQANLYRDLARGVPEALAYWERETGEKFRMPGAQQPTQPENPYAKFLLTEEEIEGSLDPNLGRNFNAKLQGLIDAFQRQQDALTGKLEDFEQVKAHVEQQRQQAKLAEAKSFIGDNILKIIEAHPDDYAGLSGKPVRAFVERYLNELPQYDADPSNMPPEFAELHEVMSLCLGQGLGIEQAHAIANYGKMNGKLAQARMASVKPAPKTPTVGVAGSGAQAQAQNLSDSQIQAMVAGTLDIPEAYLDEDGLPIRGKCPQKLYDALTKAA